MTAFSTTAVRLLLVLLVAAGAGGAIYLGVRSGGDDNSQVAGKLTQTLTVVATTTAPLPTVTEGTPTPAATLEATTVPPLSTSTPDTRPPMSLPAADQIQLGKDGKYFVADRGDGCMWVQHSSETDSSLGLIVVLWATCPADFAVEFRTATREVFPLVS